MHILTHLPFEGDYVRRFLFDGWQARMAREMAKRANDVEIESWIPAEVSSPYAEVRDGVTYRAFPASARPFGFSTSILNAVRALDKDSIVHLHGDRSLIAYALMSARQTKFVQHHGSLGPSLMTPLEALTLPRSRMIYCVSKQKILYLQSIGVRPDKLRLRTMGVDFDVFKPHYRSEGRRMLGIEEDAVVIFHPGRLDPQKGTDIILRAFDNLKRRLGKLELVLVGGSGNDPLFTEAKRRTKHLYHRVPYQKMPLYFSASDVTCYYWRPPALWYGGGGSVSVLESLACNTPVVSNTLIHYRNLKGSESFGRIPVSEAGLVDSVVAVLENRNHFQCREAARNHFSWDRVVAATLKDYGS